MNERLKIFFKLKLKEIWKGIKLAGIMIITLAIMAILLFAIFSVIYLFLQKLSPQITQITGYILGFLISGFMIFVLYLGISDWIKSNWKEAGRLLKKEIDLKA